MRVGVIGDPVAHSLSPAIQQPALDALGVDARYERWHTAAADLPARLAGLRAADALGANVTVPHKLAVMPLLDEVSPLARRAGAVNTVVNVDRSGRLLGENTDVHGFAAALAEVCPEPTGRRALLLGAGGAARAVVLALQGFGVAEIVIANRDPARAARIAADLSPIPLRLLPAGDAAIAGALPAITLLVNATSLGWHPGETPLPLDLLPTLPADCLVIDLTYRDTDLLLAARARALATLDGLPMLVHQGARALELWTGRPAPLAIMLDAARRARQERGQ